MGPKIVVKVPLNKQVVNNNHRDIRWSREDDLSLTKVIAGCDIHNFNVSNINIEKLSTMYNVPIDFLLKKFIQLYNEMKLKELREKEIEENYENNRAIYRAMDPIIQPPSPPHIKEYVQQPSSLELLENHTVQPASPQRTNQYRETIENRTEVDRGQYSYYIDKNGYSSDDAGSQDDESDEDNLLKSSEFLLHRSRILPLPKLEQSSLEDLFNEVPVRDTRTDQRGFKFSGARANRTSDGATIKINNEDVNGIISNKKPSRRDSEASVLTNRSELEKLLLDRL